MFSEFFFNKAKEVLSFLHLIKGKATRNVEARKKRADTALRAMKKERQTYLKEKREAEHKLNTDIPERNDHSGQDISAI